MTTTHVPMAQTLLDRWPTLLAIAFAALSLFDAQAEPGVGVALAVAAAGYVTLAALDRPGLTWPLVVVFFGGVIALRAMDVEPLPVLIGVTLLSAVVVVVRRRSALHLLQVPVALVALATFVAASGLSDEAGAAIVGVGLLGHAAWDTVLWRRRAVVSRSMVEWCAVFDVLVGVGLLVLVAA